MPPDSGAAKAVQREADDALAPSLAEAFELCEAFKPKDATDQQLIEWRSFLRQLTARKAQKAEPATVKNVVRTVTELYQFQFTRGRAAGLADVGLIDLSSFLTEGISAPSRALPALRWFSKHAALDWALGDLVAPERTRQTEPGEHQAVAALPFMATELESRIFQAHSWRGYRCLGPGWLLLGASVARTWIAPPCAIGLRARCIVRAARASRQPRGMVLIGRSLLSSLAVGTGRKRGELRLVRFHRVVWCSTTWVTVGLVQIHRRRVNSPSTGR